MGIDIYWVFQARKDSHWIDIPSEYRGDRDYYLYGWLGMSAGMSTHPIFERRGLPPDFLVDIDNRHPFASPELLPPYRKEHPLGERYLYQFMGEWGFSWLLGSEILDARVPVETMKIWVPIDVYKEWDKISNPKPWHELHSDWQKFEDAAHYATPENITEDTWRVIIDWEYDFTEDFEYFVGEVRRLMTLYGDVRFVFGFA